MASLLPQSPFDDDTPIPPPRHTPASSAWVLVLLDGLLLGCGSFYWLTQGRFFDDNVYQSIAGTSLSTLSGSYPAVERVASAAVRLAGVIGLCASILVMIIALTGYRACARWAWYAVWTLPFYCSLEIATLGGYGALTPTAVLWDMMVLAVALLALVLPYRSFFAVTSRPVSDPWSSSRAPS